MSEQLTSSPGLHAQLLSLRLCTARFKFEFTNDANFQLFAGECIYSKMCLNRHTDIQTYRHTDIQTWPHTTHLRALHLHRFTTLVLILPKKTEPALTALSSMNHKTKRVLRIQFLSGLVSRPTTSLEAAPPPFLPGSWSSHCIMATSNNTYEELSRYQQVTSTRESLRESNSGLWIMLTMKSHD